ncbi:Uncharacterized protein YtpQ, UPF0354 family [Lentibacillus halodurans]|uniref:UPF0354 protein SAMN04488072_12019 n=1 Tax=Lentibacillus halodurans TaxID=237679 RepID=A0A1I1AKS3_9BACI|nr:DUF1444 domain-containing protein [Lentibacillus halodurans]SFB37030.1 Uncharacterized protein YtpQ, UPF0354 family [Lentibacillus halodurans]
MKMTSIKMKQILEDRLANDNFKTSYNRDKDTFRIEWKDTGQGMTITLPNVVSKYNERGEATIDDLEEHVSEAMRIMHEEHHLTGMEKQIFPVIRATSFPVETKSGKQLVHKEHTAETRVYYALDLGKSYQLIDESMLEQEGWTRERIDEIATFNIRSLDNDYKQDTVADNDFYFVAKQDGYDASRILNEAFLEEMLANAKGELAVAVPHQDVLIFADIQNKAGYDILAQMTMKFFAEGRIPITSLSFIYENKMLEPVFILAKNRPEKK